MQIIPNLNRPYQMLLDFSVENFKSFKEKQDFSFKKIESLKNENLVNNFIDLDENLSVLKSCLIYGRNASGKSNFLEALNALTMLVNNSTDFKLNESIPYYNPFRFDKNYRNKPIKYWIEFFTDETRYKYHIKYNENKILKETLTYYPKGYPANLFERKLGEEIKFGTSLKGEKKSIEKQLLDNQLFLSKAANSNNEQLKVPYLFLVDSISPVFTSDDLRLERLIMNEFKKALFDEEEKTMSNNLNILMRVADTGIKGLEAQENLEIENKIPKSISGELRKSFEEDFKFQLNSIHKLFDKNEEIGEEKLNFEQESSGTKKLAALGGAALVSLLRGNTFVVDELDNSLHPHLTKFIIQLFHSKKINKKNAQLLFATHDVSLLSAKLFRRDQVWFVEKDKFGASELYSLADFKGIRGNEPLEKWYLSGRFGATPVIDELELDLNLDIEDE